MLYTFPHRIGAGRICHTAWQQVNGVVRAGADVSVHAASVTRRLHSRAEVRPTLAVGPLKVPYRVIGQHRALAIHDRIVAARLPKVAERVDIVHAWPLGALKTLEAARRLGIPTVLERPNAHTRFAYEVVRTECARLGVELPHDHEHAYNREVLEREEAEYELADRLLCPSDFVVRTFLDHGFSEQKLVRHLYGFDETTYYPGDVRSRPGSGLTMLFVGVAAVRKGLHFALEAWLRSPASREGRFLVAGEMLPAYAERLSGALNHPSVHVLGHRRDVPELMRQSDIFVLPSLEEGSALACSEALGSGAVPLVSDAASGVCRHGVNSLIHVAGDVETLSAHMTAVHHDRSLLETLRTNGIAGARDLTWTIAGQRLMDIYREELAARRN